MTRRIPTENAYREQWRMLLHYSYESNIRKYFNEEHQSSPDAVTVDFISGAVRQGEAYFTSASAAPLDIAPLLLYYGATNLLAGIGALINGAKLPIEGHGLRLHRQRAPISCIAATEITPHSPQTSALHHLASVYSPSTIFEAGTPWSLGEVFTSLPDLRNDAVRHYPSLVFYTVPVQNARYDRIALERVAVADFIGHSDPVYALNTVVGFKHNYLRPQFSSNGQYLNLRKKLNGGDVGAHTLFGMTYFSIPHEKNGKLVNVEEIMLMFLGMFALGYLSRYYPEKWNPFVRADNTGEGLIVERFLSHCLRAVPNRVLDRLSGERVEFIANSSPESLDQFDADDIRHLVSEEFDALTRKRRDR